MTGLGGRTWTITAGADVVTVAEVGAGLRSFTRDGADVTCHYGDDELPPKGCGTTLVPWPNRIRGGHYTFDGVAQQLALTEPDKGNAIHGLGRWTRWSPVDAAEDSVRLALDVVPQKGYPFQVHAEVGYALDGAGLTVTLSARNDGPTRAPFGMGSHPYLSTRGAALDDVVLRLPAAEQIVVDDAAIPTGTTSVAGTEFDLRAGRALGSLRMDSGFAALTYDDGFGGAQVTLPDGRGARLWFDESFRFLQAYTVDEVSTGQSGIALEPMTCAADAFNSGDGLRVLEPGEEWTGRWGITPS